VGPRAGLDAEARRKILCLCRGSNPGRPVRSQTLCSITYSITELRNKIYHRVRKCHIKHCYPLYFPVVKLGSHDSPLIVFNMQLILQNELPCRVGDVDKQTEG
jgi:hypothetical protein